ncbi:FAD-dependent oxidoreductase [Panacibacter sp. DH6]|uniref:D-amino-acid oxidase n=1 Tax=Panacibacter microcysteis TaxID=2793269 RepID=A0A931GV75_9BACT|nr:FAD-dependent oxidoreductase [Panacibacter microcysteis]MBG9377501.1 FAD-dependent oxidoreductase [Panacibacter microcysteis]
MGKKIAIIGAGISGMSTALLLTGKSHNITIFASAFSPGITSNKAAAFWFPYHIRNDKRGIGWCRESYHFYSSLIHEPSSGISIQKLVKVLRHGVAEAEPVWIDFMPEGAMRILPATELPDGIAKAYEVKVPLIETQLFLPYLKTILETKGAVFIERTIGHFSELQHDYDCVINCAALGAKKLCNDAALIPVRGQVGLLEPAEEMDIYLDNEKPLYIVPRKDAIIVGGTYEEHVDAAITEPATIERLLGNAYEVFPALRSKRVLGSWAGVRPYRQEVRVEREAGTNIIHNYGHGGSGFTLAFGCAKEVAQLVDEIN